jgi:hypothetical protein
MDKEQLRQNMPWILVILLTIGFVASIIAGNAEVISYKKALVECIENYALISSPGGWAITTNGNLANITLNSESYYLTP